LVNALESDLQRERARGLENGLENDSQRELENDSQREQARGLVNGLVSE
jgi:hypothetical protein